MGRPKKEGADYFPHFTRNGKTIFTLESMYGNDGYAFWFKLLEILCATEEHYFCARNTPEWLFLVSKTRVSEEKATAILDTLAVLNAIDPVLWAQGIIWCGNLVENLTPVYAKRKVDLPVKPEFPAQKVQQGGFSGPEGTQRKGKESKGEESKEEEKLITPRQRADDCPAQEIVEIYNQICQDLPKVQKLTETRKRQLKARWAGDKIRQSLGWWREYFKKVEQSDFLCGRLKEKQWIAGFDFLLKEDKMVKILEGGYENNRGKDERPEPPKVERKQCTDCKLFPLAECPEETRKRNRGCPAHENAQ